MKRMIGFFVIVFVLITFYQTKQDDFLFLKDCKSIITVSNYKFEEENFLLQNGNQYYYKYDNLQDIKNKDFISYNFYFDLNIDIFDILNKCSFFYQGEQIEDYQIYYGYYGGYNDFRYVNGKKINIQVVKTESQIIVGFPLIIIGY